MKDRDNEWLTILVVVVFMMAIITSIMVSAESKFMRQQRCELLHGAMINGKCVRELE